MPNIVICTSKSCPIRHKCYRQYAISEGGRQEYANYAELKRRDPCEYFYPFHTKAGGVSLITKFNKKTGENVKR
jgi:hypothetical protein